MGMSAQEMADAAKRWLEANPGMWEDLVAFALHETSAKRRFSISEWVEEIRYRKHAKGVGGFKVVHCIRAVLARLLVREYPEVKPYMSTKKSVLDEEEWQLSL